MFLAYSLTDRRTCNGPFTSEILHVRNGHSQDGQLVGFTGQCGARRYHVAQFVDVRCHLVSSATLYLTMRLPSSSSVGTERVNQKFSHVLVFLLPKS